MCFRLVPLQTSLPLSDVFCNPGKIIYQLLVKTDNSVLFCVYLEFTSKINITIRLDTDAEKQNLILYASIQLKHNVHLWWNVCNTACGSFFAKVQAESFTIDVHNFSEFW